MDRIIDVHEVQERLDEAARDATRGPAEVRAGRFLHREWFAERRNPDQQGVARMERSDIRD
jgi:hypothetical protein